MKSNSDQNSPPIHGNYFAGPAAIQGSGLQINISPTLEGHELDFNKLPRVENMQPLEMGVHRTRSVPSGSVLPEYVERDTDESLRNQLSHAANSGGFVLLVGPSASGKTRSAFEAIKSCVPRNSRVFAPNPGENLGRNVRILAEQEEGTVLWLDDLDRFIRAGDIYASLLGDLTRRKVAVVATLRYEAYAQFRSGFGALADGESSDSTTQAVYNGARLLDMVEPIEVPRTWSDNEVSKASEASDSRITQALQHRGPARISQYLAAAPELWRVYLHALRTGGNLRGAAIVKSAIDLVRTGLSGPFPSHLLERTHTAYLVHETNQTVSEAFEWASRVLHETTPLLEETGDGQWVPFDYLVDATSRAHEKIPREVWDAALDHAGEREAFAVGWTAYLHNEFDISMKVMTELAKSGNALAMANLGILYHQQKQVDTAETWYARSAAQRHPAGMFNLGLLNYERGELRSAESLWVDAAQGGEILAMQALGIMLHQQSRLSDAEDWWRKAANAGDLESAYFLGKLAAQQGRKEEAEAWWRQAALGGHPTSCIRVANSLAMRGKKAQATEWWHRAEKVGVSDAAGIQFTALSGNRTGLREIATNRQIRERLGAEGLEQVCSSLWPVDCRGCGKALGETTPSLVIADFMLYGFAVLHHLQCRIPKWENNPGINKSETVSWESRAFNGLLSASDDEGGMPCFLVNPDLEGTYLKPSDNGDWRADPLAPFRMNGFRYAGADFVVDQPVQGGHRSLYDPYCSINGNDIAVHVSPGQSWDCGMAPDVESNVRSSGGILVIVCSHLRPNQALSHGDLINAMQNREAVLGWLPLSNDGQPLPRQSSQKILKDQYCAFHADGEANIGRVIGSVSLALSLEQAKAWAVDQIDIESGALIPWSSGSSSRCWYTIDALSAKQFALYRRVDSWVLCELLVRHGGVEILTSRGLQKWGDKIMDVHLKVQAQEWRDKSTGDGALICVTGKAATED
ncbi:hypothetical protein [Streptomyces sp. NPDC048650]|uniref:hypothetical protein n=1 Tax=Streptomyces sp. NPDC048650 TaxID=3365583 RepID=UPI003712C5F8